MYRDLTRGSISRSLILFALPMMAGNMLQQFYNIADTLIVSRALGANALAAVGSAYTLMTFLTSIFLGLSMGSGALFSIYRGRNDSSSLRSGIFHAFILLLSITVLINAAVYAFMEPILLFLRVPDAVRGGMREYLAIIYVGLIATSLYNYVSCLLRALGNSSVPLIFLAISAVLNIALDLIFVLVFSWGIAGAAWATVIAQYVSAVGLCLYVLFKCPELIPRHEDMCFSKPILKDIFSLSSLTCLQQSVMNFGILMVQGACKQLRRYGNGRVCRRGEDRHIRLPSRTGLRQRLFHIRCAEPWSGRPWAHTRGHEASIYYKHGVQRGNIGAGVRICPPADAYIY